MAVEHSTKCDCEHLNLIKRCFVTPLSSTPYDTRPPIPSTNESARIERFNRGAFLF